MEKQEQYEQLYHMATALLQDDHDFISRMANLSSLIYHTLDHINWAGCYRLLQDQLVLGPFQGKPACTPIPLGKGVCGSAAFHQELICVDDVHQFPGHIACDQASRSELVIPLMKKDTLCGVLDLDSDITSRFDETDIHYMLQLVQLLMNDE